MSHSRRVTTFLLRLLIGLALVALLIHSVGLDDFRAGLAPLRTHPGWIASALALTFAALMAGVIRWHLILRAIGLPTPFARTFRGFFIGQYFNAFLFGACGGDLVRAFISARDHPDRRTEAATSVILDRAIGLAVTLFLGGALLLPRLRDFARHPEARFALLLMAVFLLATIAFLGLFFTNHLFERHAWLQRFSVGRKIGSLLRRAYEALFLFRRNLRRLTGPALLSVANLLLLAAATAALARAIELTIPFRDLLVVFPVITVLAAVPLTPGSLGVRESLYIYLLAPFGIPPGPALLLSLLGFLAATAWSLFGGLLFLKGSAREL